MTDSVDKMDIYKLIGLDQMEASIVRRHLHRWCKADEEPILPLISTLQKKGQLSTVQIMAPRWETNVYPLYYWAHREVGKKKAYDHVIALLPSLFPTLTYSIAQKELRPHVLRVINSEIDILVEDVHYFAFIEAKEAMGQKIRFQDKGGVRQLIRQYIQGKILEKLTGKVFALATIGANQAQVMTVEKLSEVEHALLQLVRDERHSLEIVDLSWTSRSVLSQSAG